MFPLKLLIASIQCLGTCELIVGSLLYVVWSLKIPFLVVRLLGPAIKLTTFAILYDLEKKNIIHCTIVTGYKFSFGIARAFFFHQIIFFQLWNLIS